MGTSTEHTSTMMSKGGQGCEKCKDLELKYRSVLESEIRLGRRLAEMGEQLVEARRQRSTAEDDLLKISGRVASWERAFVGNVMEYAKQPPRKPGQYVAPIPDVLGDSLMTDGFNDIYAKFLYHGHWLHVHMGVSCGVIDFSAFYSFLEIERNTFADARWTAPYHAKLAEYLAKEGLSRSDWDITIWDPISSSSSSELSKEQIELLPRLVVMWEKFYSDDDSDEDTPNLQYQWCLGGFQEQR